MESKRQRVAIGVGAIANKAAVMLMGTVMSIYIGRNGSPFAVGLVYTVFWAFLMIFSPIWGSVADITGKRRAVLVGTALLATLGTAPLIFVNGVGPMIGFRALFAVFAAGFLPVMLTIVNQHGGASTRGRSLGFFNSATAVGLMAGQFFSGILIDALSPNRVFLVVTGVSALVAVACAFVDEPTATNRDPSRSVLFAEIRSRLVGGDTDVLHRNGIRWLYVAVFLRNMTVLGVGGLLPIYLVARVGVSTFLMGALLTINPICQVVFMYVLGRVSDIMGRKPLIVGGAFGSGLYAAVLSMATVPTSIVGRVAVVAIGFLLLAGGFSALMTGTIAFIGDIAPEERESELIGFRQTARGLGGAIGPSVLGAIATVMSYSVAFAVGSLLSFVAAAIVAYHLIESHPSAELDASLALRE
ncbi:MFS transporter [Halocatena marina]|uniref:MFS transporter n=1 Tax=Halocatena marina TaxID=2934937 RepID=UPI00200E1895|nr:MFS transporter [Halocatena marina]